LWLAAVKSVYRQLRALIAVVPQSPLLLTGPVSANLDPAGHAAPATLLAALRDVGVLPALRRAARQRAGQRASRDATEDGAAEAQHDEALEPLLPTLAPGTEDVSFMDWHDDSTADKTTNGGQSNRVPGDGDRAEAGAADGARDPAAGGSGAGDSEMGDEEARRVLALPLGRGGAALSASQAQLLALARALLRRPRSACS
jgi:hypothetical protein